MFLSASTKTAVYYRDQQITYNDLFQRLETVAADIANSAPQRVAIFSENCPEWIVALYAGWKANATVVPIDYMATEEEVNYILNDCQPEIVFTSEKNLPLLKDAIAPLSYQPRILMLEDIRNRDFGAVAATYDSLDFPEEKTALIIYTSGTTGSPKGVMLSFQNLTANVISVSKMIPIYTDFRRVLILLPLHHIFPLLGSVVAPLCVNSSVAMAPSIKSSDIISTIKDNKVSIIIGVPRLYEAILKGILSKINANPVAKTLLKTTKALKSPKVSKKIFKKVHDTLGGNIDYLVCGGAKLDEDMARNYKALGFEMLEGFGMTEAAPMLTFTRPGKWIIGSAGQAMPGVELVVKEGELVGRGKNIMQGYFNRPDETAAILREGWLHTGDRGYIDKDGFVFVTGRMKDIIVLSNGKNVNPEEIENKLSAMSHYAQEVAVIAKDDQLQCIIFPDYSQFKHDDKTNLETIIATELIEVYNKSASPYKRITKFYITKEELPKTRLGKVKRFELESLIGGKKKKAARKEPQFEEYIVIRDFLKEKSGMTIAPDDHFDFDLALDSLEKINFQVFLESTFGITLDENFLQNHPTVEKLANFMREKKQRIHVETIKWSEILREKIDHLSLPKSWFTHNLFKNISKVIFHIYFRVEGSGVENLPQAPFIIAPNHQSFFDGLFVSMFLKKKILKDTYYYAKAKHVKPGLIKAIADRNNVIVMDINKDLKLSMQKLAAALRMKKNVIIFPEGTRSTSGNLGDFKKFFAVLSLECGAPVVPVSIVGADIALPKGSIFPRPWKKITVKFHSAIYPDGHSYDSLKDSVVNKLAEEFNKTLTSP